MPRPLQCLGRPMRELCYAQPSINTHQQFRLNIISQWAAISSLLGDDQLLRLTLATQLPVAKDFMTTAISAFAAFDTLATRLNKFFKPLAT